MLSGFQALAAEELILSTLIAELLHRGSGVPCGVVSVPFCLHPRKMGRGAGGGHLGLFLLTPGSYPHITCLPRGWAVGSSVFSQQTLIKHLLWIFKDKKKKRKKDKLFPQLERQIQWSVISAVGDGEAEGMTGTHRKAPQSSLGSGWARRASLRN